MASFLTRAQSMGPAALIMAGSVFLSRFMGLIRDKVISYLYGAGPDTDIYFTAFVIPDFINYLLAGGYFSITLIPLLSRFFRQSEEEGWRFFSAAFWWIVAAIASLTIVAWIFAHELSALAAPGFEPEARARLAQFMRIILPAQACFLPGACFTALLFMRRQFFIPALTPLVYNGCIILGGIFFFYAFPGSGMEGFLWGVLAGAFLGSLVLPFMAVRAKGTGRAGQAGQTGQTGTAVKAVCSAKGEASGKIEESSTLKTLNGSCGLNLSLTFTHPGLKKFILLALPLMLGQSITVLDEGFLRIFGSLGEDGGVSLLNYARRIMMVPVGVVAQAAGVASYPFLAQLVAAGDREGFNKTLNGALMASLAVIIPLGLWMMAAAEPTMRLIFEQGRFTPADTALSSLLLVIMLCAVGFWAIQQILGRGFYANENTLTPVLVGSLATVLTLPLYYLLSKKLGAPGVALAGVLSMGLYTALLLWRWKVRQGGEALNGLTGRATAIIGISLPCAAMAYLVCQLVKNALPEHPLLGAFLSLCASGPVFGAPYLLLCRWLTPALWQDTVGILRRKLKR